MYENKQNMFYVLNMTARSFKCNWWSLGMYSLVALIWHWAIPENIHDHTCTRMAFRNSEGKGGSLNWKSKSIRGYDWNSEGMGGGVRSGISTGERWECIPWKRLLYWLNQFANKAWTDNTADVHGRQASIDQWCFHTVFICRGKPTKSGFYIKLQKNMLQNSLFFSH